jgi:acetyl esterase/lipase
MTNAALPPLRTGRAAPDDLVTRRAGITAVTPPTVLPPGVTSETRDLGGVACVVCSAENPTVDIVYLHGGGYRLGTAEAWASFAGRLAARASARVVVVDYRLAPEDPFPAALHDALAVANAIRGESDLPLFVGGDSAGGGLAMALALALRDSGAPAPAGVIVLSPWVDLTITNASYTSNAEHDQLFSFESASEAAELYLQGHDARDPLASPALADLRDFPPAIVFVSAHEALLDDACALARGLGTAGIAVELHVVPDMPHVWPFMLPAHEASERAFDDIARFVRTITA